MAMYLSRTTNTIGSIDKLGRLSYSNVSSLKWKSVIGLEVHAQINAASKLFSGAANEFASPVNSNASLFDCSIPGTLPVLNKKCVEAGVKTALALNCRVNPVSTFDRKHYFYADIPAGYQITQQRAPLAVEGYLQFHVYSPGVHKKPYVAKSKIKQIQLEQDSGKSLHDDDRSLVDLNRAGAPLMELVFEPDLADGEEAAAMIKELTNILQRIGTCSCKMEEGALRVDANISVHKSGQPLGIRTEVKNIGSVRGVAGAVKYEIQRQIEVLEQGGIVINETRAWDAASKKTIPMRDKEQQQDYRYMPEPNLPPLHVAVGPIHQGCVNADELKALIPELPEETRTRYISQFDLTREQAIIIVNEPKLVNMFEEAIRTLNKSGKLMANLLINEFMTSINKHKIVLEDYNISGSLIAEVASLIESKKISKNTAKLLVDEIVSGNTDDTIDIVTKNNWLQVSDSETIDALCEQVLQENPKMVVEYKKGKVKVFKALLGCVAKKNKGVNMVKVSELLKKNLDNQR